jgi:VanZ family protein
MWGLALVVAATLFPFDFSFEQHISFSNSFKLSKSIESRGNDLIIGADAAFGQPLRGKIDELRIYRIALTPLQIAQEAKTLPGMGSVERPVEGLVASYSFNETSGAVLRDDSGNGNEGKLANGPGAEGRRGALVFNGSGQYVRVPNSPSIDIGGMSLTILMRIALQDSRSDGVIIAKPWHRGVMQYPYYQYGVEFDGSGAKSVDLYLGDTSGRARGPFSVKPPLEVWTHVAFVYDGVIRGYVDGREQLVAGFDDPWDLGDFVGNLLLFIPLGFGLAIMARSKRLPPNRAVPLVLLLGAGVSLGVETLQCWLPGREPSLIDIAANCTSSILGAVLYLVADRQDLTRFVRFLG